MQIFSQWEIYISESGSRGLRGITPNKWAFGAPNAVLARTVPAEQYAVCQKVLHTGAVPHRCQFFCPA